ncbi:MAG: hypothetical protein M0Z95_11930 [Actinomycetota bacterium]|jgi:hypothetical protein|nr:hypothetical protein [Actinomycetota bacterium]
MAGIDDLSVEQLEELLKRKKTGKRVRVREYEVDESDFRSWFGIGEKSAEADDDSEEEEPKKRRGWFE